MLLILEFILALLCLALDAALHDKTKDANHRGEEYEYTLNHETDIACVAATERGHAVSAVEIGVGGNFATRSVGKSVRSARRRGQRDCARSPAAAGGLCSGRRQEEGERLFRARYRQQPVGCSGRRQEEGERDSHGVTVQSSLSMQSPIRVTVLVQ